MSRKSDNKVIAHVRRGSVQKCIQLNDAILSNVVDFKVNHAEGMGLRQEVLYEVSLTLHATFDTRLCDELPDTTECSARERLSDALGPTYCGAGLAEAVAAARDHIRALASVERHLELVKSNPHGQYPESERANAVTLLRLIDRAKRGED